MMGLCWNGKVHQTAKVPLSPLDQEATKATFNKLTSNLQYHHQIPALLASFSAEGLRVFMNWISDNFGESPIYFTLATISVPFIDDESGIDCAPFNLAAKHFGQVLKLAEEILGPNEVTTLTDDAPLFSLGAIRHFLHVDAQHKPKPQALSPCGSLSVGASFSSAYASSASSSASAASATTNIIITSTPNCPDLKIWDVNLLIILGVENWENFLFFTSNKFVISFLFSFSFSNKKDEWNLFFFSSHDVFSLEIVWSWVVRDDFWVKEKFQRKYFSEWWRMVSWVTLYQSFIQQLE